MSDGVDGSNQERFRITEAGNVGIGTTSPDSKLTSNGRIEAISLLTDHFRARYNSEYYTDYSTNGVSFNGTNQTYSLIQNGTTRLIVDNGGNVGIGTTSPDQLLDVSSDNTPTIRITNTLQSSSNYTIGAFEFFSEDASTPGGARVLSSILCVNNAGSSVPNGELAFYTALGAGSGAAPTEKMRIDSSGNVGIGTASPSAKLDVVGSSLAEQFKISNTTADATTKYGALVGRHYTNSEEPVTGMLITSSSSGTGGSVSIGGGISAANAVNNIILYTAANNTTLTGTERMRVASNGNVGIGTTSPQEKLDVGGSIYLSNLLDNDIIWKNGTLGTGPSIGTNLSAALIFKNSSNNAVMTIVNSDGSVGIGTTSPGYKLDVSGTGRFTSTVTATNFILSSDKRKKTKIKDLTCDNIDVNWKSFELKESEGEYRTGVIAQELEQSHPEFVKTDGEGFKSVKYIDLLIAKIAELEARLEKLEK